MPVNNSPIHSIYLLVHPIPTGLGCIRNVARLPQLSNLSHISLQVSITSNKLCLKSNSLVQCMPSITLSSLSLLLLSGSLLSLLSISSLLSDSMVSLLLSTSSLLSDSMLLSSLWLLLLSNSFLLSVSTQPALLAYTMLLLRPNSVLLSDSLSLSISQTFLTSKLCVLLFSCINSCTSNFCFFAGEVFSSKPDLCLSLICLSRLYFEANLRGHIPHLYPFSTVKSIFI